MVKLISLNDCYSFVKRENGYKSYHYKLVAKSTSSLEESRHELLKSINDAKEHGYALLDQYANEIRLICMRSSRCIAVTHDIEKIINHSHITYSGYILIMKFDDLGERETLVIYCENRDEAELNIKQIFNKRYTYESFDRLYQILRGLKDKNEHYARMTCGEWFEVELYDIKYYAPNAILREHELSVISAWDLIKHGDVGKSKKNQ